MTWQEHLLAEFLAESRPDIIIFFTNSHDHFPLTNANAIIKKYLGYIDRYVTNTTTFIWVTLHHEDVNKMPDHWKFAEYVDEDGKIVNRIKWIRELNNILFRESRERFVSGRNPLMFLNLFEMARDALRLNFDGVHLHPYWYQNVMSIMMQAICES